MMVKNEMKKYKALSESEKCQCSTTRIGLRKKFEGDFSVKIIQNLKKSVIVKLLFNESCITVGHGFTVQLYKLEVSLLKPQDATLNKFIWIHENVFELNFDMMNKKYSHQYLQLKHFFIFKRK